MHDRDVGPAAVETFFKEVHGLSGDGTGKKLRGEKGLVALKPVPDRETMGIAEIQQVLRDTGFLPGGAADGIFGYRTQAAVRLFQEYVRSIEGKACLPDGIAGPKTARHLRRWSEGRLKADWAPQLRAWEDGSLSERSCEFNDWLAYLEAVKLHYQENPSPLLERVNAFAKRTDTRRLDDWEFSPLDIHLIGIRHGEQDARRKFDDALVLLIKGMVFKFQGSTDPGSTKNPKGAPFLVHGQHDFRFGVHRRSYHALRPLAHGVLVVRSKGDILLSEEDLGGKLERNGTINIHWGGKGVGRAVNRWSEGCQVITGAGYENHHNDLVSCARYVGINNGEVKRDAGKTRGAYNVLSDLTVAFSSDMLHPALVKYTLLRGEDLALDPKVSKVVTDMRTEARRFMKRLA
jgi:hypothetical protein